MQESPSIEVLNDAFRAFVCTVPNRERLDEHLAAKNLGADAEGITASLEAVVKTVEDFLYHYPGGVPWTKIFLAEFRDRLHTAHPWLDARSHETIMAFAQWLCWHDGLDAPQ